MAKASATTSKANIAVIKPKKGSTGAVKLGKGAVRTAPVMQPRDGSPEDGLSTTAIKRMAYRAGISRITREAVVTLRRSLLHKRFVEPLMRKGEWV